MSDVRPIGPAGTAKTLWRRAPAWRLLVMSACLLTLLFVLFAPGPAPDPAQESTRARLAALETATYAPRPAPSVPAAASQPAKPAVIATPSAAVPVAPAPIRTTAAPAAEPKTATLSMVTANGPATTNESGLDPAVTGSSYRGSARIDGFDIPLPSGDWVRLAKSTASSAAFAGDIYFLGQIRQKRLVGAMRIFAMRSKTLPGDGFGEVKSCTEVNPYRISVVIDEPGSPHGHQACWTTRNVLASGWSRWADRATSLSAIDRAAAGDMAAKGVTYPQDMIMLTFTRAESWGLLEVGYLFSPDAEGIASATVLDVKDSDWTAQNLAHEPDKAAYVDKLKAWGSALWPRFKAAFDQAAPTAAQAAATVVVEHRAASSP